MNWQKTGEYIFKKECPACGADLLRSNHYMRGYQGGAYGSFVWRRPWRKNKFVSRLPELKIFAWACMGCGRVFLSLKESDYFLVKKEFEELKRELPNDAFKSPIDGGEEEI
ncbi:MAG: hypothetical protein ACFFAO_09780 [Candidatus Hermodarchaeota archaeon]